MFILVQKDLETMYIKRFQKVHWKMHTMNSNISSLKKKKISNATQISVSKQKMDS